ncbi:mammalian cell entry protein [Mycobacteroides immunogenum]|uniref:Mammalian cell entry protein n=2 Tax=Mycobacteriaceae TaxID=1762 RepID=A0A7V8LMP4_9MYCO|nr:mammalian cell entry protein [Mycobacteroides immunogenum]ANO05788.1 mammalian cell entry protein [Mycobacteroides immunogenum]KPG05962.1 mammalian cell entry protein [Mycobacteroides immunogenum]KPG07610.1 mammalian cell entry protein [Mycobacteroides immunogenum]KPG08072.1 mammalian cell entry protein [Mycobacteroides immunogenum]
MVAACLTYIARLGVHVGVPDNRTNLSMDVADVNNLVIGSNVLLRGVPVGKIDNIETSTANATIHFYIDNRFAVPADSVVRLENLSALGESYLELEPKTAGGQVFRDGQRVAPAAIVAPKSISELGSSVVRVLNQLDPEQLQHVVGQADAALPDPYSVLPNLERASQVLNNTTIGLDGRGRQALENLQSLLENAGFVGSLLAQSAPSIKAAGEYLVKLWRGGANNALRNDMPGSVYIFGRFMQRIQQFLDDRGADLRVLTEPLTPNIQAIASALGNIDSSQILTNLLAATPPDGAIELHVALPRTGQTLPTAGG